MERKPGHFKIVAALIVKMPMHSFKVECVYDTKNARHTLKVPTFRKKIIIITRYHYNVYNNNTNRQ